jgi:hypothetical protein
VVAYKQNVSSRVPMAVILERLVYLVCICHVKGNMRQYKYWPLFPFSSTVGDLTQAKKIASVIFSLIKPIPVVTLKRVVCT